MLELGRDMIARLGGKGVARGWSLKEDKNKCQIYNHFLPLTNAPTGLLNAGSHCCAPPTLLIYLFSYAT